MIRAKRVRPAIPARVHPVVRWPDAWSCVVGGTWSHWVIHGHIAEAMAPRVSRDVPLATRLWCSRLSVLHRRVTTVTTFATPLLAGWLTRRANHEAHEVTDQRRGRVSKRHTPATGTARPLTLVDGVLAKQSPSWPSCASWFSATVATRGIVAR